MKFFIRFAVCVCLALAVGFGWFAFREYQPVIVAKSKTGALKEVVIKNEITENATERKSSVDMDDYDPFCRVIDFSSLKKINSDIIGWIYIPDTSIDYPVLVGDTDTRYLYKDFEGKESKLGSIFSYADTDLDARTVLFGHNMSQYVMFGELKRYVQEEIFRTEHKKLYMYTEKSTMEAEIFSVFTCKNTDSIFYDEVEIGSLEYQELLRELSNRNQYADIEKESIDACYNAKSFTLVTCRGSAGTTNRLVISYIVSKEKYILG